MTDMLAKSDAARIPLADSSVHMVACSPPYFGLRSYLDKGDPAKAREMGAEPTPAEFVEAMVAVGREIRRVLRPDGTFWLNLGDSYVTSPRGNKKPGGGNLTSSNIGSPVEHARWEGATVTDKSRLPGLKQKDLIGIPWRVAFALQADGWYLRTEIVWHKPSVMPESVTDRPTRCHEYLFLLSKSPRYFYDAIAIREADAGKDHKHRNVLSGQASLEPSGGIMSAHRGIRKMAGRNGAGRNKRSVWEIAAISYAGAHFATYPPKLVEPCILAGTSEKGVCPACGVPWVRVVEKDRVATRPAKDTKTDGLDSETFGNRDPLRHVTSTKTVGWSPSCKCGIDQTVPAIVLDPFCGSGTTIMVARQHGRRGIGLDLDRDCMPMARERIGDYLAKCQRPHKVKRRRAVRPYPSQMVLFAEGLT